MRKMMLAAVAMLMLGSPAFTADPSPDLTVELSMNRETKFADLAKVLSAVRSVDGMRIAVTIRGQMADGIAVTISASQDVPFKGLSDLSSALKSSGVTLTPADKPGPEVTVELSVNPATKYADLAKVLSVMKRVDGTRVAVTVRQQKAEGIAVTLCASRDTPFRVVSDLCSVLKTSGVIFTPTGK